MLLRFLPLFFALLALFALTVDARPARGKILSRRLTIEERSLPNAERLKRNLPPRAPVIGRVLPGREALEPTPASKAKRGGRPSPSPSPSAGPSVYVCSIITSFTMCTERVCTTNTGSAGVLQ